MKKCPLCGWGFTESGASSCAGCPLSGGCGTVCCPHCGYKFVESSKTIDFLKGIFKRSL